MMGAQIPRRVGPDRLLVPMSAVADDGVIGDGAVEIGPEHPDYQRWVEHLEHRDDPPVED
jgi:hypothetical protein